MRIQNKESLFFFSEYNTDFTFYTKQIYFPFNFYFRLSIYVFFF